MVRLCSCCSPTLTFFSFSLYLHIRCTRTCNLWVAVRSRSDVRGNIQIDIGTFVNISRKQMRPATQSSVVFVWDSRQTGYTKQYWKLISRMTGFYQSTSIIELRSMVEPSPTSTISSCTRDIWLKWHPPNIRQYLQGQKPRRKPRIRCPTTKIPNTRI